MKVGDLIRPKRNPGCVAVVLSIAAMGFLRVKVLVVGSTTPETCDPRMWEVISESR